MYETTRFIYFLANACQVWTAQAVFMQSTPASLFENFEQSVDFDKAFEHADHNILREFDLPDIIMRWMCAFLINRRQRVKIDKTLSEWMSVGASMHQGSYLGPLTFIMLTDHLRPGCLTHKYIDDTKMTETIKKAANSHMQSFIDDLVKQSTDGMNVNQRKTKELLISSIVKDQPPQLTLNVAMVERVITFKLLRVHVSSNLKWTQHVDGISSKISSQLHYLKQLKRSGVSIDDLLCFDTTVVRPVLEYACPV